MCLCPIREGVKVLFGPGLAPYAEQERRNAELNARLADWHAKSQQQQPLPALARDRHDGDATDFTASGDSSGTARMSADKIISERQLIILVPLTALSSVKNHHVADITKLHSLQI